MAVGRHDKANPGTQTAGSAEGAIADGVMSIEVHILMTGAPSAVQADYATLVTNVSALATGKQMRWEKR